MSYETVIQQIQETPEQYLEAISFYIEFINYRNRKAETEKTANSKKRRLEIFAGLQKFRGRLPDDFDADKELAEAREQKYS